MTTPGASSICWMSNLLAPGSLENESPAVEVEPALSDRELKRSDNTMEGFSLWLGVKARRC